MINSFEEASSNRFEASVVATMSSGKSTLINALIQQDLMPAKQEACTAIITKIMDDNRLKASFDAKQFDRQNQQLKKIENVSLAELENWNNDPQTSYVELVGNIPFIEATSTRLELVDTPGPNNSRNSDHEKTTYESLGKSSKALIIYILNATQLSTNDDNKLLVRIAESMKSGGKKSRDRFIFVVNKLDNFDPEKDDIEGALERVKDYLEGIGIQNPNIFGVSAKNALDIRTVMKDRTYEDLDEDIVKEDKLRGIIRQANRTKEHHFENYAPLVPSHKRKIQARLELAQQNNDKKEQALIHSGIPSVEEAINIYVSKYAVPQKIKTLSDTFEGTIRQLKLKEKLRQEIVGKKDQQDKLQQTIEYLNDKLAKEKNKDKLEAELKDDSILKEVDKRSKDIIDRATKELDKITAFNSNDRYSKEVAEEKYKEVTKKIDSLKTHIEVENAELLSEATQKKMNELIRSYTRMANEIFENQKEEDKLTINPFDISRFQSVEVEMKNLEGIINEEEVKIGTRTVKDSVWYNPLSWFRKREVAVTETVEYINAGDFMMLFSPVKASLFEVETEIMATAEKNQKLVEKYLQKRSQELEKELIKYLERLKEKTSELNQTEEEIQKIEQNNEWLEHISNELAQILSI